MAQKQQGVKKTCIAASLAGIGGGERNRTAGLLIANQTLSQLSYTPKATNAKQKFVVWKAVIRLHRRKLRSTAPSRLLPVNDCPSPARQRTRQPVAAIHLPDRACRGRHSRPTASRSHDVCLRYA